MERIENWAVCANPDGKNGNCITGEVYGHPNHKDGETIITAEYMRDGNGVITTATGMTYVLGSPNPAYAEKFPESVEKLME